MNRAENPKSIITGSFEKFIEFGNRWLTLSGLFFRVTKNIFIKVEVMMLATTLFAILALSIIEYVSFEVGLIICLLLFQRIVEYFFVYSRNFILNKGRVFTDFTDKSLRSQWLILMFLLNLLQINIIFATWYHFLSFHYPDSFSQPLGILNSFYYSFITFVTIGYGDIIPIAAMPKIVSALEGAVSYYTLIIVINGLISMHFNGMQRK